MANIYSQMESYLQENIPTLMKNLPRNEIYLLIEIHGDSEEEIGHGRTAASALVYNIRTCATSSKMIRLDKKGDKYIEGERGEWQWQGPKKGSWSRPNDKYYLKDFEA